jgi:hypothetical protein
VEHGRARRCADDSVADSYGDTQRHTIADGNSDENRDGDSHSNTYGHAAGGLNRHAHSNCLAYGVTIAYYFANSHGNSDAGTGLHLPADRCQSIEEWMSEVCRSLTR